MRGGGRRGCFCSTAVALWGRCIVANDGAGRGVVGAGVLAVGCGECGGGVEGFFRFLCPGELPDAAFSASDCCCTCPKAAAVATDATAAAV